MDGTIIYPIPSRICRNQKENGLPSESDTDKAVVKLRMGYHRRALVTDEIVQEVEGHGNQNAPNSGDRKDYLGKFQFCLPSIAARAAINDHAHL